MTLERDTGFSHRFEYIPPSGPVAVSVIAPGQYGSSDVQDWRERSACFGYDTDLFFGTDGEGKAAAIMRDRAAKAICASCEVKAECLDFALRIGERNGIWGGLNPNERRKHARFRRVRRAR